MSYERAPPLLGADTDAVLGERLGLDAETPCGSASPRGHRLTQPCAGLGLRR